MHNEAFILLSATMNVPGRIDSGMNVSPRMDLCPSQPGLPVGELTFQDAAFDSETVLSFLNVYVPSSRCVPKPAPTARRSPRSFLRMSYAQRARVSLMSSPEACVLFNSSLEK